MKATRKMRRRTRFSRWSVVIQPHLLEHVLYPIVVASAISVGLWLLESRQGRTSETLFGFMSAHLPFEIAVATMVMTVWIISRNIEIWRLPDHFAEEYYDLLERVIEDYRLSRQHDADGLAAARMRDAVASLGVINARTGQSLRFAPDSPAVDFLFDNNGLISITDARPSDWLNPTYNFFLASNYVTHLTRRIRTVAHQGLKGIDYVTRTAPEFERYRQARRDILSELAGLRDSQSAVTYFAQKPASVRFYLLTVDEFERNRSTIELLVAGHELVGCYLFLCNAERLRIADDAPARHKHMKLFLESMAYDDAANLGKVDFAIGVNAECSYLARKGDQLTEVRLSNAADLANFFAGLKSICDFLSANFDDGDVLFDKKVEDNLTTNQKYAHAVLRL